MNGRVTKFSTLACGLFVALMVPAGGAGAQESLTAIVGARIIPVRGHEIADGVLLVKDGRIVEVGTRGRVVVPDGAVVIEAKGKVVMPGLVDTHSHIGGVGGADASGSIQPEVRIIDAINPLDSGFKRAKAGGITTLNIMPGSGHLCSGQTLYAKNRGGLAVVDDLFIKDKDGRIAGGLKMANGTNSLGAPPFSGTRGKSAAMVRERFIKAREYAAKVTAAEGDTTKLPPKDLGLEAMVEAMNGTRIVHHHTHRADDIMTVLRLKKEFGFRVVLQHVSEAWLVADEIAAAGAPCSVIVIDSPGGKMEAVNLSWGTGKILDDAGVLTCFHTDDWITDSRLFLRSGGLAVRAGMDPAAAVRALTINAAEMLDLAGQIGSLEVGKDADFIVLSGDPFSVYTHVEQTWVEGVKVFDRGKAEDRLFATGGFGAGRDQEPYMCCAGQNQIANTR